MRKESILTTEQLEELIAGSASEKTKVDMIRYLVAELNRRRKLASNKSGGRPKTNPLSTAEQNRLNKNDGGNVKRRKASRPARKTAQM